MREHLMLWGKAVGFFAGWLVTVVLFSLGPLEEPGFLRGDPALTRLWWELTPLLGVLLVTWLLAAADRPRTPVKLGVRPGHALLSLLLACLWLGGGMLALFALGELRLGDPRPVDALWIWLLASTLNVVMQEYLVRGYLFSLIRGKYGAAPAIALTTALFTAMHGGVFAEGIIPVLNVVTMSVLASLLLLKTGGLLAPIIAHALWNGAGGVLFGVVGLAEDYPSLFPATLLSGGEALIEGTWVVLAVNLALIAGLLLWLYDSQKKERRAR